MTDDTLKRTLEKQDALQRYFRPLSAHIQALRTETGVDRLIRDTAPMRDLMRTLFGPLEDMRRSGAFDLFRAATTELQTLQSLSVQLERQFRLPQFEKASDLVRALDLGGTARAIPHYRNHLTELHKAIKAITVPWVNVNDEVRSLKGLAGLQEIGHTLNNLPVHSLRTAERLRLHLGDWRAPIDWPAAVLTDPVVRSDFYVDRGLDPALTAFPATAFAQAIAVTGIKHPPPPRMDAYDHTLEDEQEDDGFERNNAAHDRLQRFESLVREFIDRKMTAAIGENWIKHRVPGDIRRQWNEKQQKARDEGESEHPMIAYADFTDYATIIVRNDNWEEVFKLIFRRKTLVQESFQRLYPIRLCTMHARIITQDDELYLLTETRRLLKAMGTNPADRASVSTMSTSSPR